MKEIIFLINEAEEGGFTARALGESIFTDAETMDELKTNIQEAIECHFDNPTDKPKIAHLHFVKDEILEIV
ncbi:2-oxoisovalerate dehydrogenase [Dyadobacter sp. CY312]|jgi:predicted RNase H-like HicB family nuclease|uniref:2-oxoisovalerate dehydrogenase n=1 Tax=Dyadobacter sp. CY312 TaxID=2907303 RepID=UPI001F1DC068|nr:2-oxoisovalerate dehydrogenase [Dyadobacter sp. CY312]MCE7042107.1 2-oxoisovalerate dehydrogenase [Dyadobacter sp. CY312]